MVDLLTKNDYLKFFEQIKYLRSNFVKFHFLLVKMVHFFLFFKHLEFYLKGYEH